MVHLSYLGGQNIAIKQSRLYLKIYFHYTISTSYSINIIMMLKFIFEEGKLNLKRPDLELIRRVIMAMVVHI